MYRLLYIFLIFGSLTTFAAPDLIRIDFYFQPGCKTCLRVKKLIIPQLSERYAGKCILNEYDTTDTSNFLRLLKVLENQKDESNESAYVLINDHILLKGTEIEEKIFIVMDHQVQFPIRSELEKEFKDPSDVLSRRAAGFTVGAVILAGLIDGINPCVFSTLVFFLSLLSIAKVKRRKLLAVGLVYSLSCFITYLLLGCGFFYFLQMASGITAIRTIIDSAMVAVLLIFSVISFLDAFRFSHGGGKDGIWLKLPDSLSNRIHRIMKSGISYRILLPSIFFTGILVTIMESVCTGQVYIPTLFLMAKEAAGIKWISLLLVYNFMFMIPLLLVFFVFYRGISTMKLINWSKQHVVIAKCLMAIFFILLAIMILFFSF